MEAAAFALTRIPPPPKRRPSLPVSMPTTSRSASFMVKAEPPIDAEKPSTSKAAGSGFGTAIDDAKKKKRGPVVRRSPMERPSQGKEGQSAQAQQQTAAESAFLLTWLGLGIVILVEGLALAASGFLPEEWDKILVKYLYPSFTPTVFLFVCGTVGYGVIKYLEGEKMKS